MVSSESTLHQAEEIARAAGELLAAYFGDLRRTDAERKGGLRRDLVSVADREAERLIFDRIPAGDDITGEEGTDRTTGASRRWIVDPLDGTVNFLHGLPFWAVSIGIVDGEDLVAAVVHAPALGETFTAAPAAGCRRNDSPVAVSPTTDLAEAVLATGFAYDRDEVADDNLDNFAAMVHASAGLRRFGAASLDLAYTACGRLDGFWELHLAPWDVAAGALLVRLAGGEVTDFAGSHGLEEVLHGRNIVASNGHIHTQITAQLAPLKGIAG